MSINTEDIVHSEEQLRNTLHCDDKEKLRRKLAQLQREYLKTAQRLKRAERQEVIQRHVKSRISHQNHQRDPEDASNPSLNSSTQILNTSRGNDEDTAQQENTEADCDASRRSQVIRFILPSDNARPQTSDSSQDSSRGHRHNPALRLRSQRSRLRWERRSAEASRTTNDSQNGQEQGDRLLSAKTAEEETTVKSREDADVGNESEELFSGTEAESFSLLLTHWNSQGCNERGDKEGKDSQRNHKQREKETHSEVEGNCCKHALTTEERAQNVVQKVEDVASIGGQEEVKSCKENGKENTEGNEGETIENEKNYDNVEMKEKKSRITGDEKTASLLDSCTLVEGLLYPAEYYVRTTRRMTFSQSQPDMQAVILSQLSMGRRRRSRGSARGPGRDAHTSKCSDQHARTDFSSPVAASTSQNSPYTSPAPNASGEPSQSSCKILNPTPDFDMDSDFCFSPKVTAARPPRGRRKSRGRGRGRSLTPQSPLNLDSHQLVCKQASGEAQATITSVSSSQLPASTCNPDSQPSSGVKGAPSSSASEHSEKVYPIFLKSEIKADRPPPVNRDPSSWTFLLLPSSSPAQTSLLPLSSLSSVSLLSSLKNMDFYQDFHLPDDQFASLKLHKLRQVAVESGVEQFLSPYHNTRSSSRRLNPLYSDPLTPPPLPLSATPTVTSSSCVNQEQKASAQKLIDPRRQKSTEDAPTDEKSNGSLTEEPPGQDVSETDVEQQTENLHTAIHSSSTDCVSKVQHFTEDCVGGHKEHETVTPDSNDQSSISACSTDGSISPRLHQSSADRPGCKVSEYVSDDELKSEQPVTEKHSGCHSAVQNLSLQGQMSEAEYKEFKSSSSDYSQKETPEQPLDCAALHAWNEAKARAESPVQAPTLRLSSEELKEAAEPDAKLSADRLIENKTTSQPQHSELSLCSAPASAPCPFVTPHLPSATLISSPILPSLGITPHRVPANLPVSFSPSAPSLTLPPPHSPSGQVLSPPALSPCPSITFLPPSLPLLSPSRETQASCEPPAMNNHSPIVEPAACPTPPSCNLQSSPEQAGLTAEESEKKHTMRHQHTLKSAAGGFLVDVCCLLGSSGSLCVAAAGKWAVCLWSQTSASDWSLTHTWTFHEPVINVFPVPDAAGMMCATLGKLEIREVRMLSCSSLMQMPISQGVIQAVVGVSRSRVVTSSHSTTGSTLQVFTLSNSSSGQSSQPLVSPGGSVEALAPVDGLPDALVGTGEGGHLFIWNLKTGQLLCKVLLGHSLSHTACLRGYSYAGVLLVLLQHQFLNSLEEEGKTKGVMSSEEEMKMAWFSLVGINPLSGKSVRLSQLYPPKAWSDRLSEVDVNRSSVVGLSQSGCACVWGLGPQGAPHLLGPPEGEGWQLARWGEGDTLVIGHNNGDVSLHCWSVGGTTLCR
ncbi:partner and localizer of BRCA2 [Cololabis saira]|uniref:partner and localizer of BRCA2 n=1 Tax=Cololabis saira TaxID=129043 RepID=UPI002AD3273F|nr:partner and localizer of BRCA2 [Cololabis saira]